MDSIKLKTNEFWGLRAGYFDPRKNSKTGMVEGFRIDISKWGQGRENQKPVGKKARKVKSYTNAKLRNRNYA